MDQALKDLLAMANLYGLSAKKHEYIDRSAAARV